MVLFYYPHSPSYSPFIRAQCPVLSHAKESLLHSCIIWHVILSSGTARTRTNAKGRLTLRFLSFLNGIQKLDGVHCLKTLFFHISDRQKFIINYPLIFKNLANTHGHFLGYPILKNSYLKLLLNQFSWSWMFVVVSVNNFLSDFMQGL